MASKKAKRKMAEDELLLVDPSGTEDGGEIVPYNPYIKQDKKISFDLQIRDFPWTEKQMRVIQTAQTKEARVIFIKACAGVGKTLMATYVALQRLKEKRASKLMYVRAPVESCSRGIGFLPSTLENKMEPYLAPAMDHLNELVMHGALNKLLFDKHIEAIPMGFLKGLTLNSSTIILDEAEDLSPEELRLAMCRLGKKSLMFVIGDEKQQNVKHSGFTHVFDKFNDEESRSHGIHCFEFDSSDCLRSDVTQFIINKFDSL